MKKLIWQKKISDFLLQQEGTGADCKMAQNELLVMMKIFYILIFGSMDTIHLSCSFEVYT